MEKLKPIQSMKSLIVRNTSYIAQWTLYQFLYIFQSSK